MLDMFDFIERTSLNKRILKCW